MPWLRRSHYRLIYADGLLFDGRNRRKYHRHVIDDEEHVVSDFRVHPNALIMLLLPAGTCFHSTLGVNVFRASLIVFIFKTFQTNRI